MVGIIILNYNSAADTIKCIQSIKKYTTLTYMIYIVDGCSQDNSYDYLLNYYRGCSNINILKTDTNGGYSYGNNFGVIKAICDGVDAILVINPDVILINDAIGLMYSTLFNQKNLAVVGPRILNTKNEDMQYAAKLYTFYGFLCSKKPLVYLKINSIRKKRYYNFDSNKDYCFQGMVSGSCFMIKATDFETIGFFDTNIFLYYEEDIIAYKLFKINRLTKIVVNAIVIHNHSSTVKKEGVAFMRFHRFFSSQYVLRKYAKINLVQYIIVSFIHIIPFTIKALVSKSYMKLYFKFWRKIILLYRL